MTGKDRQPDGKRERIWIFEREISRRELLKGTAAAGIVAGLGGILAACGGDNGGEAAAPAPAPSTTSGGATEPAATTGAAATGAAEEPTAGGRLRIAVIGGGTAESFDPALVGLSADAGYARSIGLFDRLVEIRPDLSGYDLSLADSFEANADATEWTIRIKPDITFHDGKPLTIDDVIYTIKRAADDPSNGAYIFTQPYDVKGIKKQDDLSFTLPLTRPIAGLEQFFFTGLGMSIVQDGAKDFSNPIGTGPFTFDSFKVGESSLMKKNPNYWQTGKPLLDELEINSVMDADARLNALRSGDVDAVSFVPFPAARSAIQGDIPQSGQVDGGDIDLLISDAPSHVYITMAVDLAPFDNNDVRQAMRLIADRQALVDTVNVGFGSLGNDIRFPHAQFYDDQIPQREQDIEQAKSLLKKAGAEGLKVTLYASDWGPGMLNSATVFAEQAKAAGVDITIDNSSGDTYLADKYLKVAFGQSFATPFPIPVMYSLQLVTGGIWNETHWNRPEYDDLVFKAQGEQDEAKATELWAQAQQIQWDEGGDLIWGTTPFVDGLAKNVRGATPNRFAALSGFDYRNYWLAT
jgi:peptide/nickel transport system substrate-binding protein